MAPTIFLYGAYSFMPEDGPLPAWVAPFVAVIELIGVFSALFFMANIRKK